MGSLATTGGQVISSITKLRVDQYAFTLLPHDAAHNRRYERRHQPTPAGAGAGDTARARAPMTYDRAQHLTTSLAGRYAVEHEIGRGGMATVHLAHDESTFVKLRSKCSTRSSAQSSASNASCRKSR